MPTSFASYDLDQSGSISADEWASFYPDGGGPMTHMARGNMGYIPPEGPFKLGDGAGPGSGSGFDVGKMIDFFSEITSAFGQSGFEFSPELMEAFGVIMPAMGLYSEFSKADYQMDALDFMREELGIKGQELELARKQLEFESGDAWDWYVNEFFPASMENQRLEFDTQRALMEGQRAIAGEDTLQARERTSQAREGTRQSEIASEIARYNALRQMGMGRTTETADGRQVRGSGFTYGYA